MIITELRPLRRGFTAVYTDGEYAAKIDTRTLSENGIRVGSLLDGEQLEQLETLSDERRAKEKALRLISYRDHSKKELKEKISRTCDPEAAEKAAERMEELGLIDDEAYARRLAERLIFSKRLSKSAAARELSIKGIDRETADEILEDIEVDSREQIRAVIEKKYPDIPNEKVKRRAVAALQRLGYGAGDIRAVIEEYTEEYIEDDYI